MNQRAYTVIEDWLWLRQNGCTLDEAARRIGIKPASLERAIWRYRTATNEKVPTS